MIAPLITGYAIIGAIVAVLFTERVDGGEFGIIDFLFIVMVWPLALLAEVFR